MILSHRIEVTFEFVSPQIYVLYVRETHFTRLFTWIYVITFASFSFVPIPHALHGIISLSVNKFFLRAVSAQTCRRNKLDRSKAEYGRFASESGRSMQIHFPTHSFNPDSPLDHLSPVIRNFFISVVKSGKPTCNCCHSIRIIAKVHCQRFKTLS